MRLIRVTPVPLFGPTRQFFCCPLSLMVVVYALCPANTKVFTLGRHRTNDVQLNDLVASKFHARITWQNVYWQNFFWLQVTSLPL